MIDEAVTEILYQISNNVYHIEINSKSPLPALCYLQLTDRPEETTDLTGYRSARYQISAVSNNANDAAVLAKQVRQHLKILKGSFGNVNIFLITETNTTPDFSGDPNIHRKIIDFNFYYGEQP